jgi:hypothetical protein
MKERQQSDFSFVWFLSQALEFTGLASRVVFNCHVERTGTTKKSDPGDRPHIYH